MAFRDGKKALKVADNKGAVQSLLSGGLTKPEGGFELYWKEEMKRLLRQ